MVLLAETLESVFNLIITDEKIMKLMDLPTIKKNDTEKIKQQKINQVIKKAITFSAQNPNELGKDFPKVKIGEEVYDKYGIIRMTICNLQSEELGSDIFGRPRIEIDVYHLNSDTQKALKIINLLTKKFSKRKIDVEWLDDDNVKHISTREFICRGIITQIPNINFYEKSGVRFSYYASYYSSY